MLSHVVLYNAYKHNVIASDLLIDQAVSLLRPVAKEVDAQFHVARAISFNRPVNGCSFDVGLYCGFPHHASYRAYMEHPDHFAWCRFVLRGWKLVGSHARDTHAEFVEYILSPQSEEVPRQRERDATPDCNVVWEGEHVVDFGNHIVQNQGLTPSLRASVLRFAQGA